MVWITKRIPWTPGRPIFVAVYGCGGPSCSVATEGKMKGSMAAGLTFRPATGAALAKPKGTKKPRKPKKPILVGRGETKIPAGETREIYLRLNKTGAAVLKKRGKATIQVTLTATIAGQAEKVTESHSIQVYLKKKKSSKPARTSRNWSSPEGSKAQNDRSPLPERASDHRGDWI